jgi:membrane-associated HD superfamily phosphohydrolase
MGFGGLALVLFWVISALVMLLRIYNRLPQGFSRSIVLGITGMWAGLSVAAFLGDYFIPVYYNGGLYTLSTTIYGWLALGIAVAHGRNPIVNAPAPPVKSRERAEYAAGGWGTTR